jgi:hypothetical protein
VSLAVRNPTSVTGQLPSHAQVVTSPSALANGSGESTKEPLRLGKRDQQIAELLLQGCDNEDIAKQLNIRRRTVKARFNRLFLRFGIKEGIKRVKLAVLLYRRQITPLPSDRAGIQMNRPPILTGLQMNRPPIKEGESKRAFRRP